jgi:regulatory protein
LPGVGVSSGAGAAKSVKARAIALLARREYARAELRERLLAGGGDAAEVDAALAELAAQGYLSDGRYAHAIVRRKRGEFAQRAIVEVLKRKGVDAAAAREALADIPLDDEKALLDLWRRRFGQPPCDERERARQVRFLQSRGFALSSILRLLRAPPAE